MNEVSANPATNEKDAQAPRCFVRCIDGLADICPPLGNVDQNSDADVLPQEVGRGIK